MYYVRKWENNYPTHIFILKGKKKKPSSVGHAYFRFKSEYRYRYEYLAHWTDPDPDIWIQTLFYIPKSYVYIVWQEF